MTYLERIQRECRWAMDALRRADYLPFSAYLGGKTPPPSRPGERAKWREPYCYATAQDRADLASEFPILTVLHAQPRPYQRGGPITGVSHVWPALAPGERLPWMRPDPAGGALAAYLEGPHEWTKGFYVHDEIEGEDVIEYDGDPIDGGA